MNRESLPGPRWLTAIWYEQRPQQLILGTIELVWIEASLDSGLPTATDPLQTALLQLQQHSTSTPPEAMLGLAKSRLSRIPPPAMLFQRKRFAMRHHHLVNWPDPGPFDWSLDHGYQLAADQQLARLQEHGYAVIRRPREGCCLSWQQARRYSVALLQVADEVRVSLNPEETRPLASPVLAVAATEAAAFPEIHTPPSRASLQQAWNEWAASRSIPPEFFSSTRLSYEAGVLHVELTSSLSDWLREHRPDVFTADIWLWIEHLELFLAARLRLS